MKQLTRRDFGKLSGASISALILSPAILLTGCGVDAVISALQVAAQVAFNAALIPGITGSKAAEILKAVSADLAKVVDLYEKYDSSADDKATKFQQIQTALSIIHGNLAEIFNLARIFDESLKAKVSLAVAVANTAISFIISHLPHQHQKQARAQRLALPPLPLLDGAKNANDLKKAWNDAVAGSYPDAAVR